MNTAQTLQGGTADALRKLHRETGARYGQLIADRLGIKHIGTTGDKMWFNHPVYNTTFIAFSLEHARERVAAITARFEAS